MAFEPMNHIVNGDGVTAENYNKIIDIYNATGKLVRTPVDNSQANQTGEASIEISREGTFVAKNLKGAGGDPAWVRYAKNEAGLDMSATPTPQTKFIGFYSGSVASTNPKDYTWSKYVGKEPSTIILQGQNFIITWDDSTTTTVAIDVSNCKTTEPVSGIVTSVNGQEGAVDIGAISTIFESDGVTAKQAKNATNIIPDKNGAVNPLGRKADSSVGENSTALGRSSDASGARSTALGYDSDASGIASTALGYRAKVPSTNPYTIQLGEDGLSSLRCAVNLTVTSDKRDKTDIEGITDALAFIERLTPVTFVSNDRVDYISDEDKKGETFRKYGMCEYDRASHAAGTKKGERRRCGLLAQEVVEAMQSVYGTDNYANVVNDNFHDLTEKPSDVENKYTLAYANLVPFLIGAIKELNAKIKALSGAKEH